MTWIPLRTKLVQGLSREQGRKLDGKQSQLKDSVSRWHPVRGRE